MLLSDYETDKLLIWYQKCCIWSWYDQMHWRLFRCQTVALNFKAIRWKAVDAQIAAFDCDEIKCTDKFLLMSKLLHLMLKSSDALTKLFDCQIAAFDREIVKCTLTIVCCQNCIWCRCHQMHWRNCLMSGCCTRSWNDQMHADDCLLSELHLMPMSSNALTKLFDVKETAFDFERSNALTKLSDDRSIWFYRFNRCVLRVVSNRWNFEIIISYNRQQISLTRCVLKIVVNQIVFRKDVAVWFMHSIALINVNSLRRAELRASIQL